MAKIVIEGKEHTCSQRVKEEVEWQDIKLAKMIEDKQEEMNDEIQELLNQLKQI